MSNKLCSLLQQWCHPVRAVKIPPPPPPIPVPSFSPFPPFPSKFMTSILPFCLITTKTQLKAVGDSLYMCLVCYMYLCDWHKKCSMGYTVYVQHNTDKYKRVWTYLLHTVKLSYNIWNYSTMLQEKFKKNKISFA